MIKALFFRGDITMNEEMRYSIRKADLLKTVEQLDFDNNENRKNAYKSDLEQKIDKYPDIVNFLCDVKDNEGEKLFDNVDIIGVLHHSTWLLKNEPDLIKKVVSENIDDIAKNKNRGPSVFSLPGMPSMEYCMTGSDAFTSFLKYKERNK